MKTGHLIAGCNEKLALYIFSNLWPHMPPKTDTNQEYDSKSSVFQKSHYQWHPGSPSQTARVQRVQRTEWSKLTEQQPDQVQKRLKYTHTRTWEWHNDNTIMISSLLNSIICVGHCLLSLCKFRYQPNPNVQTSYLQYPYHGRPSNGLNHRKYQSIQAGNLLAECPAVIPIRIS